MKVVGLLVQKVLLRILKLHAKVIFALKSLLTKLTDCSSSCTTCSESAIACTSCSGRNSFLYNKTCVEQCPSNSYLSNDNTCIGTVNS